MKFKLPMSIEFLKDTKNDAFRRFLKLSLFTLLAVIALSLVVLSIVSSLVFFNLRNNKSLTREQVIIFRSLLSKKPIALFYRTLLVPPLSALVGDDKEVVKEALPGYVFLVKDKNNDGLFTYGVIGKIVRIKIISRKDEAVVGLRLGRGGTIIFNISNEFLREFVDKNPPVDEKGIGWLGLRPGDTVEVLFLSPDAREDFLDKLKSGSSLGDEMSSEINPFEAVNQEDSGSRKEDYKVLSVSRYSEILK